jgi:hypothetical protein
MTAKEKLHVKMLLKKMGAGDTLYFDDKKQAWRIRKAK